MTDGEVKITKNGKLLLFNNGDYQQFNTYAELEVYAYVNKIELKTVSISELYKAC